MLIKYAALALSTVALTGCVSMTAFNTIQRAKHLCENEFSYKVFKRLNLSSKDPIYFKKRGDFISEWVPLNQVVLYDETVETIYREKGGSGRINRVNFSFYSFTSKEFLASMTGFRANTSTVVITGHPASYGCSYSNQDFVNSLR